jgi:hypothetical protein
MSGQPPAVKPRLFDLVTIGITTFRRPRSLLRLLESIELSYPDLPVVVVNTESNLSLGRNRLAQAVATPLLMLCEDDFEFSDRTRIEPLADVLAHDATITGVGGELLEPRGRVCWAHNYHRRRGEVVATPSKDAIRRTPAGIEYQPCELIFNFGLFRCELFRQVLWDEEMPLNEHLDYYWRVSQCWSKCMSVVRDVAIHHHKDRPTEEYIRLRGRNFLGLVDAKHHAHFRTEGYYEWSQRPDVARA